MAGLSVARAQPRIWELTDGEGAVPAGARRAPAA